MSDIQFMEKPDWVSWEDVCDCIHKANTVNDKKGFHMLFANITPGEIEDKLKGGKCFVALHNNHVIGTTSFIIRNLNKWYMHGNAVYYCYDGILPEYRGTDVYFGLSDLRDKFVRESGIRNHQFHTAENNKSVIKINKVYGYRLVLLKPTGYGANYYQVTMVRWDDGCPFPNWFVNFMFKSSKIFFKLFFTPEFKFKPSLKRF